MPGEALHKSGIEGVRKAKQWLDGTTRADVHWTVYDDQTKAKKLDVDWANNKGSGSFDLAGMFKEGEIDKQLFFAEIKNYKNSSGALGGMYEKFLALCYRACYLRANYYDNFMWITWAPFSQTDWAKLTTAEYVEKAVNKFAELAIESSAGQTGGADPKICKCVADRLWFVIFGPRQTELVATKASRAWIASNSVTGGGSV